MKKKLAAVLVLLLTLSACNGRVQIKEPVRFYYCRAEFEYGLSDGVIYYEEHEASGHLEDLPYLITLYLTGPVEEDLRPLFPSDTQLVGITQSGNLLSCQLNSAVNSMTDSAFSLASACLAKTCFELADIESVRIYNSSRSVTLTIDNLVFEDDYTPNSNTASRIGGQP